MSVANITNEAIDMARKEVLAIRKVLKLQQGENIHLENVNQLVNAEIDGLKKVVEKKQIKILEKEKIISKRDIRIKELEESLEEMRTTRSAIKEYADQNSMLLEKFEEQRKAKEQVELDRAKLEDETRDLKDIARIKAENLMKSEAGLITDLHKTNQKLVTAMAARRTAESEVWTYRDRSVFLVNKLKESEDKRVNQIERSRQSEYRTIQRTEELLEQLRITESDKDTLESTLERAEFRGDTLQDRLTVALKEVSSSQDYVIEALHKTEDVGATARLREKLLLKEVTDLRGEIEKTKRVNKELYTSTRDMGTRLRFTELELNKSRRFDSRNPGATRGPNFPGNKKEQQNNLSSSLNMSSNNHYQQQQQQQQQESKPVLLANTITIIENTGNNNSNNPFAPRNNNNLSSLTVPMNSPEPIIAPPLGITMMSKTNNSDDEFTTTDVLSIADSKTGRFGMGVGGATDPNKPTPLLDVRPDGRQRLLMNLIETFAAILLTAQGDKDIVSSLKGDEITLSNCGLIDADLLRMLDRLRYIPLSCVKRIDLRGNMITREGADYLTTWLLSLKSADYIRDSNNTLTIDLRGNEIDKGHCKDNMIKIRQALAQGPEVKVVDIVNYKSRSVLTMYGPIIINNNTEEKLSGPLVKIDFGSEEPGSFHQASGINQNDNTPKKRKPAPVSKKSLKSSIYDTLPALSEDDRDSDIKLLVPRNDIMMNYEHHPDQDKKERIKRGMTAPAGSRRAKREEDLIRAYH